MGNSITGSTTIEISGNTFSNGSMRVTHSDEDLHTGNTTIIENNIVKIKSNNPEEDIPKIINNLSDNNVSINSLDVKRASLEDVFLKLTGKSINDK